jgi:hypothetical protein
LIRIRQQHSPAPTARIENGLFVSTVIGRKPGHKLANTLRRKELPGFTVRNSSLKKIAQNVLSRVLHQANQRTKGLRQCVNPAATRLTFTVSLRDDCEILLFHLAVGQSAHAATQKILERLAAADTGPLSGLVDQLAEIGCAVKEKLFTWQE